eukprot:1469066-Alexandrium_andersonii.AAC.1
MTKDCADCTHWWIAVWSLRGRDRTRSIPGLVSGVGVCAGSGAERTPRKLRGPLLRLFLCPRSSRFERLMRFCIYGEAECGPRAD